MSSERKRTRNRRPMTRTRVMQTVRSHCISLSGDVGDETKIA